MMETLLIIVLVAGALALLSGATSATPPQPQVIYVQTFTPEPRSNGGCLLLVVGAIVLLLLIIRVQG